MTGSVQTPGQPAINHIAAKRHDQQHGKSSSRKRVASVAEQSGAYSERQQKNAGGVRLGQSLIEPPAAGQLMNYRLCETCLFTKIPDVT
jgi:hypothetical protein